MKQKTRLSTALAAGLLLIAAGLVLWAIITFIVTRVG